MPAPDIAVLLENFPPQNSTHRADLLSFARTAPLTYGSWRHLKKLYKLAEAPALSGEEADVELLGALLGRIDAAPIPDDKQPQLKLLPDTPQLFKAKTVRAGNATYRVGGRWKYYNDKGWRLAIDTSEVPAQHGVLGILKAAIAPQSTTNKRTYDFDTDEYIGKDRTLSLKNGVLEIVAKFWNHSTAYRVDVSDPDFAFLENSGPRAATWQYMKRRARRLLRKLSTQRPELYRELLHAALRETFSAAKGKPLNSETQWASMDALFARSTRWKQIPAARGPYQLFAPKFHLKVREERAPEIWDTNPDWARKVFLDEKIPVQANAVALRVLRAGSQEIPEPNAKQLLHFLNSDERILQTYATRLLAASSDLRNQPPETLAAAILISGAPTRRKLQQILEVALADRSTPAAWRAAFAKRLSLALEAKSGRRTRTAASLLSRSFAAEVSDKTLFAHLALFLENSGESGQWISERIRLRGEKGDLKFLDEIALLPEQFRARVLEEFSQSAQGSRPQASEAVALVTKDDAAQNRIGWQFLEATAMEAEQIRELWKSFSRRYYHQAIFEAAFSEAASARLWRRAEWKPDEAHFLIDSRLHLWTQNTRFIAIEFFDAVLESLPAEHQPTWIFLCLAQMQPQVAEQVLQRYVHYASGYAPKAEAIHIAFSSVSLGWRVPALTPTAWKFLADSNVAPETLREVWRELWNRDASDIAFGDVAAGVLRRAEIPDSKLADWLQSAPIEKFSPRFFLLIIELAAPAQKVELLLRPPEDQWQILHAEVLALLRSDEPLRIGFWNGAWQGLENNPALLARFDEELTATFNTLSIAAFASLLPSATDAHEPLAMSWLDAHADELLRDENLETLILTATHATDAIRLWGLRRVRERGLSVAIALRLMESGLPQPFALGREYFESGTRDSTDEKDYALALCDSPKPEVQNYGREFLLRRASTLLDSALLQNLTEHPDAQMQSWVATQLLQTEGVDTAEFDTTILRAKGKARRAKESVKKRVASNAPSTPSIEASALLELARGTSARDREWALQQLAQRALGGEEIRGLSIKK